MDAEREEHRSSQLNPYSPPRSQETKGISKREILTIACLLFAGLASFNTISYWQFTKQKEVKKDVQAIPELPEEVRQQMEEYARMTPSSPLPTPQDFND